MRSYFIIVLLIHGVLFSCGNLRKDIDSNNILNQYSFFVSIFYDSTAFHIDVNSNDLFNDLSNTIDTYRSEKFERYYLTCENCDYSLPIEIISGCTAYEIFDLIPLLKIDLTLDSEFIQNDSLLLNGSQRIVGNEIINIVDSLIQHEIIFGFSDIVFALDVANNVSSEKLVSVLSIIQNIYFKYLLNIGRTKPLLFDMNEKVKKIFKEDNMLMLIITKVKETPSDSLLFSP